MSSRAKVSQQGLLAYKADAAHTKYRIVVEGSDADHVKYPAATTDRPLGITVDGCDAAEDLESIGLLGRGDTKVVKLNGTCNKGDWLTAEDPAVAAVGQARAVPATAGAYWVIGRALEAGADEQEIGFEDCFPFLAGAQHEGQLGIPSYTGDPTTPVATLMWHDHTNSRLRTWVNGAAVTISVICWMLLCSLACLGADKTPVVISDATTGKIAAAAGADNVKVPGTLEVTGASTLTGNVTFSGSLEIAEGGLKDSMVVTGDIKDGTITAADIGDVELAALGGLTSAANAIPYFTGSGTAGVVSSSANVITFLGSANNAAMADIIGAAFTEGDIANSTITTDDIKDATITAADIADVELAALGGLTSAANAIPYFTGSGTAGVISSSANIVSLLASADYATARTNLGVAIGSDVQGYDADLAALANVTSAANAIPYFTGSGTAGVISSSANVVTFLGSANNAAMADIIGAAFTEGDLANSTVTSDDIKDGDIANADISASAGIVCTKLGLPAIRTVTQAVTVSEFTDGTGTSGYLDLSTQIPTQSIVLGWQVNVTSGFAGDTTAVVEIGKAGATSCFSADTAQSVLGVAKVGSASVAATSYTTAATTVRVTVTGGADFTTIKTANTAAATITVYYIQVE